MWLHHTRIAARSPPWRRLQSTMAGILCSRERMLCPHTVLLCCRCCQAPFRMFFSLPALNAVSHRPDRSGGFLWRWDLTSPTTFSPCGLAGPSPDSLCVFRRELEGLCEATPSIHRLFRKARTVCGPPPPAPWPTSDSAPKHGLCLFQDGPLW